MHRKLDSVCLDTRAKAKEEFKVRFQQFKVRFQLALDTKDAAQLCELLEGPGDSQAYDVDVGNDIIVRCHRKIVYPNGTVYIGFVDTATGLPDGEGSVTWGASILTDYTGRYSEEGGGCTGFEDAALQSLRGEQEENCKGPENSLQRRTRAEEHALTCLT